MRYLVINGFCCCLNVCCKEIWQAMYQIVGKKSFIKILYCIIFLFAFLSTIGTILILQEWSWFMKYFAPSINCNDVTDNMFECLSSEIVYRVCFCLFIFSILMVLLVSACSSRIALILNEGLFFTKYVLIMVLIGISFHMGGGIFYGFGQMSSFFSYIFIIIQSIIFIDLAYLWGISWASRYSEGNRTCGLCLIIFSIAFFILSIICFVEYFRQDYSTWIGVIGIVEIIIIIGVQLLNYNKQNSLLATSIISLFIAYQTMSSKYLHPSSTVSADFIYLDMCFSFILVWVCTFGSIYGSSNHEQLQLIDLDNREQNNNNQLSQKQKKEWRSWLIYLIGLSMYLVVILTNWGSADIINKNFNLNTGAWANKIFFSSITFAFYCWSLIAPKLFPQRNFYFQ